MMMMMMDNDDSCPTADWSIIGLSSSLAYYTGELLDTPWMDSIIV